MTSSFHITKKLKFDNSIRREEWHIYSPSTSQKIEPNDEVRIPIHYQDIFTTPHDSCLLLEGKIVKADGTVITDGDTVLTNNGFAFLFDEIRYELFGVEVDKVKNVGITSTIKNYLSLDNNKKNEYEPAGWNFKQIIDKKGTFFVSIPLKMWLGFFEDNQDPIIHAKQELILIRSRTDANAYLHAQELVINITKVQWRVKQIYPSDEEKLTLLKTINSNEPILLPFRKWNLYEYPLLPESTKHTWAIKTSNQLEKPRYVILAFQTGRKRDFKKDSSKFDNLKIENVKVTLNSENYPYENLNIDFDKNDYATLYEMYVNFQKSYYKNQNWRTPVLNWHTFKSDATLFVIDCSRQNEALKNAPVDISVQFESKINFPQNTSAYCLILNDCVVEYKPFEGTVQKLNY